MACAIQQVGLELGDRGRSLLALNSVKLFSFAGSSFLRACSSLGISAVNPSGQGFF